MAFYLRDLRIVETLEELSLIPSGKIMINCINANSYNIAQNNEVFAKALKNSDYLIPDGISIVMACKWLKTPNMPKKRIVGWDLFELEMNKLTGKKKVMFVGSSEKVLAKIHKKAAVVYPNLEIITYSPPFKHKFTPEDSIPIVDAINSAQPDLLWIGMTAPKQELWISEYWDQLTINCHVGCIGAVFDFFSGNIKRAPKWWQNHSLEWLYRLIVEPKRMWKRYLIGNPLFVYNIIKEWIK
jgi:N-acetylglucosaminyldiphosphoundecaprenol N-acetyl-beta-D-mannosaminyltransferase